MFVTENEWPKTKPVPIPIPRVSRNFSDVKTRKEFVVLTWGKFLEALGSRIGTGSVFWQSFSVSNNVQEYCQNSIP